MSRATSIALPQQRAGAEHQAIRRNAGSGAEVGDSGRRPIHVCFVAMNAYPVFAGSADVRFAGGAEVQQAVLARLLHAEGFRVSVLTADCGQDEVVDCDGIEVHRVRAPANRGIKGLRVIHPHVTDVVAALRRIDPDVVYFRMAEFRAAAAAWYAWRHGKRFVYACASDLEFIPSARLIPSWRERLLFRWALRHADAVLLQNRWQKEQLALQHGKQGVIVPNCYSEPQARPANPQGRVLWVGTVKPLKSPERFVELARRLPERRFVVVGGPNEQSPGGVEYFSRLVETSRSIENLSFVGHVPFHEVGRWFDGVSVLINTSDTEGFPNTFLQAWVRGVPTLSFVAPELEPGVAGTIVCRDLADMAARLSALSADRAAWQLASDSCRTHFQRFHSPGGVLPLYRAVLQHPAG